MASIGSASCVVPTRVGTLCRPPSTVEPLYMFSPCAAPGRPGGPAVSDRRPADQTPCRQRKRHRHDRGGAESCGLCLSTALESVMSHARATLEPRASYAACSSEVGPSASPPRPAAGPPPRSPPGPPPGSESCIACATAASCSASYLGFGSGSRDKVGVGVRARVRVRLELRSGIPLREGRHTLSLTLTLTLTLSLPLILTLTGVPFEKAVPRTAPGHLLGARGGGRAPRGACGGDGLGEGYKPAL